MKLADNTTRAAAHSRKKLTEAQQVTAILLTVLLAFVAWGVAVAIWGLPGLYIPALCTVPVVFVCLLLLTVGR